MKNYLYLLLLVTSAAFAQTKDTRAELNIQSGRNLITVTPSEKIWISNSLNGNFCAKNIYSSWDTLKLDVGGNFRMDFGNVFFFNKDTALIFGIIVEKDFSSRRGCYLTFDGGTTFRQVDFGDSLSIVPTCVGEKGRIWAKGSSGGIYFSRNYGRGWRRLPYNSGISSSVTGMFMCSSVEGCCYSDGNLFITNDNWESVTKLESPFDQKKCKLRVTEGGPIIDDKIDKVAIWGDFIVVEQNRQFFYTKKSKANWKAMPVKIFDFAVDNDKQLLYAVADSGKVLLFASPENYSVVSIKKILEKYCDLRIVNHSLYVVGDEYVLYKINTNEFTRSIPYSADEKINRPSMTLVGKDYKWGFAGENIYLSENEGKYWYRESVVNFDIKDAKVLDDSSVILWDGRNNYTYSVKSHKLKPYQPFNLFRNFLSSPVKSFSIYTENIGCDFDFSTSLDYTKTRSDSTFKVAKVLYESDAKTENIDFANEITERVIRELLVAINKDPSHIPSGSEFQFSRQEKEAFLEDVNKFTDEESSLESKERLNKIRSFYRTIPNRLDELTSEQILEVLDNNKDAEVTHDVWFNLRIVNTKGDQITFSKHFYMLTAPWLLPWVCSYNGLSFTCYNSALPKFIKSCVPEKYLESSYHFKNSELINDIALYLLKKEHSDWLLEE